MDTTIRTIEIPIRVWPHLLAPAATLLLFALPPFPHRRLVHLTTFITLSLLSLQAPMPPLPAEQVAPWPRLTLALALVWMHHLGWLAKMLLHRPEHDFWRVGRPDHEAESFHGAGLGRAKTAWALSLLASPRGVGWNFGVAGLRPRGRLVGRWRFVAGQVLRTVVFGGVEGVVEGVLCRGEHAALEGWRRVVLEPVVAGRVWLDVEVLYACCNAVLVAGGLAEEKDCLPLFGNNITRLDSLREFWGQLWPQTFRVMFEDFGHYVCWCLGIHRRTRLSRVVQVCTSFLISGAAHAFAMSACAGPGSTPFRAVFGFFILQAVGLTIEDLALDAPIRDLTLYEVGLEDEMIMGRIWTFGWLWFSFYWVVHVYLPSSC
ncbi:hypothetical protein B0T25DRAFT_602068 [Lasiosphaeria hispida]|uniref:Wax synthase domain-containing protein n=1 Tax=Lasiosphaeria hispida TaxID=260671 RepID=A0AAJ0MIR3_9PEZI|nr:hypothetical protein B0T25DRAFT_602068 [Lasiosphaeria hispida]